jgi:hypothetical protein
VALSARALVAEGQAAEPGGGHRDWPDGEVV